MADFSDAFLRNNPTNSSNLSSPNNPNNPAVQARTKAQNRANVLQLKLIGQSHPTGLTNNLLKLFEARPPLEFKPPPEKRKCPPYAGIAQFVCNFAEPGQTEYAPPVQKGETPAQRRARVHQLRLEEGAAKALEEFQKYDPNNEPNISGDPYKTLFVARLNFETSENRIKREFEAYGPIKRVKLITDKETNKPKGYAFIEYMHTRDMKAAYKQADGRKVDGRRVLVDVERGRTVPNWRPRRLGGGLGTTRVGGEDVNQKYSGREQAQSGAPRAEESRAKEERPVEREKSRERGRDWDVEREKSHERSVEKERPKERTRERDHRDEKHTRDRERSRGDRERDRGRDRNHRDRYDADHREKRERQHERVPRREKERERERAKDGDEMGEIEHGRSRDREYEYRERDRDYEEDPAWYEAPAAKHRGHRQVDDREYRVSAGEVEDEYERAGEEDYGYDHRRGSGADRNKSREMEHEYARSRAESEFDY